MAKAEFIRARVAEWEKHWIRIKAAKAKMSESEFVRNAAMNRDVTVIDGLDKLTTELRRQGNNLPQVATVLGISRAGAYELVRTAGFPSLTIGSRIIIPKEEFIAWIKQ